jgi:hypothetical protein
LDGTVLDGDRGAVLLEVEELLRFDDGEGVPDVAVLQQMAEGSGGGITCVVPAFERENRARPAKGRFSEASYGVHDRKAIGRTP